MAKNVSRGGLLAENRVCTAGAIFPDGRALEIVRPKGGGPQMLLWADDRATIAPTVKHAGLTYCPIELNPSLLASTRLPERLADQGITNLLGETQEVFESNIGLGAPESALLAAWVTSTWFPDCLSSVPLLVVHGFDETVAVALFRLLHCVCRRPLIVTEVRRATLPALMAVRPTLLVIQPEMPRRFGALLVRSNHRRLVVPAGRGEVIDLGGAKAIFSGGTGNLQVAETQGLHLTLSRMRQGYPKLLGEQTEDAIARRFQPRFLTYRLQHFQKVRQFQNAARNSVSSGSELVRALGACTLGDRQLESFWLPILESQQRDAAVERLWDPFATMIDVMLSSIHSGKPEMSVRELTAFTNTLLRARGECREFSEVEVGAKLKKLGLERRRKSAGMFLLFDSATRSHLHVLARRFGVGKTLAECRDCDDQGLKASRKRVKPVSIESKTQEADVM